MEAPRLRLFQYEYSPFCLPIELILRHSGLPYEVVNLNVGDPTPVIQLTRGDYYQVPVIEDLATRLIIYDKSPAGDDVPQYINGLVPELNLFPAENDGLHRILISYIENECESAGFKICDAFRDRWLKTDIERGLHRRHKERKFGPGCLEDWLRNINPLTQKFNEVIEPFNQILGRHAYLMGEAPVYADYALYGVIGNYLFPGNTSLPPQAVLLNDWYNRMKKDRTPHRLDDVQQAAQDQFSAQAGNYGANHILADVSDLTKAVAEIKLRANAKVLDVATGNGHAAIALAKLGAEVTASDISHPMLVETANNANAQNIALNLQQHAAEELPYPDESFHLIVARVAAHHFSDPGQFLKEASRVLRYYGHVILIDSIIPDDQIEADQWLNTIEKLRDPSHVKLYMPHVWKNWATVAGLTVQKMTIEPFKQPDINWYFDVANTPQENRKKVLDMVAKVPTHARELFRVGQEQGKTVWYWRRMTLILGKV